MTTKKIAEQPADDKQPTDEQLFYQITAREYMVTFPPYQLILYPGTSAVVTGEHYDLLHPDHKAMLDTRQITAAEFSNLFAKQGKIGWV